MLVGAGELVEERRLAAVLVACQREGEHGAFRQGILVLLLVVAAAFAEARVLQEIRQRGDFFPAVVGFLFSVAFRRPDAVRVDTYLRGIRDSHREGVAVDHQFHRIPHRGIFGEGHLRSGDDSHVEEVLAQGSRASYFRDYG